MFENMRKIIIIMLTSVFTGCCGTCPPHRIETPPRLVLTAPSLISPSSKLRPNPFWVLSATEVARSEAEIAAEGVLARQAWEKKRIQEMNAEFKLNELQSEFDALGRQ
jgi:hypothetical protein